MIVAIDGPAGAGKSSVSRALARSLGFRFLDTGAMYRAVTWKALHRGVDLHDADALADLVSDLELRIDGDVVSVDGQDVSHLIRTPEITAAIRFIADNLQVRQHLSALQRRLAAGVDMVTEGRDQGTTVFPDADCKIFLTASDDVRARRRFEELRERGITTTLADVLRQLRLRDQQDTQREVGSLQKADDAVELVTDNLDEAEVVRQLEQIVRAQKAG